MAKEQKNLRRILLLLAGLVLFLWLIGKVSRVSGQETLVSSIGSDGGLTISDGRVITLAGVRIKAPGEEGHESAIFLLSQMVGKKEIWIKQDGDLKYSVWIGCVKNILGLTDCSKGMLVNEQLLKMGVAERF